MKKFSQLLAALLLCAFATGSAPALAGKAYTEVELKALFHHEGGKRRKLITSNSFHFWAWSKNEADTYIGDYLRPEGIVIGDPHPRNVFDYRTGGKAKLAVADIDDGGEAPLFIDIVRYVTYLETLDVKMKIGDVFDAYVDGLGGSEADEPSALKEARGESQKDIEAKHQKYIAKHSTKDGKLDYADLELTGLDSLSASQKSEFAALSKIALRKTGYSEVIDGGYKVNDSGSSANMDRYWLLLSDGRNEKLLVEFKELGKSAVAYYQRQSSTENRVNNLVEAYSDSGLDPKLFGVASTSSKDYWLRPRHYQALDLDDEKVSAKDQKEFAFYMANWMGQAQRAQTDGKALLKLIEKDRKAAKNALEEMVRAYLEVIGK
jgi:hypothetical protein